MFAGAQVSPLRGLAATAWLSLFAAPAAGQDAAPTADSIDVYGSTAFDSAEVRAQLEPDVRRYVAIGPDLGPGTPEREASRRAIETKVRSTLETRAPLAYFEIHVTWYSPTRSNVTIDVVEQADAARRMPFRAPPTEQLADPGGILAAWREYEQKLFALAMAGTPIAMGPGDCPVLHCIAGFRLPELAPYLERFNTGAREHADALYAIAERSGDAQQRADALFLLAHTNDARRLLPVLSRAIYDADSDVRNNAMRVLIFVTPAHRELDYPIRDLIAALDFPSSQDRNKAAYALVSLADDPRYRDAVRSDAVPVLLRLLKLEQPNNHDPAYRILRTVSGESFGERDYAAWERWAAQSRGNR